MSDHPGTPREEFRRSFEFQSFSLDEETQTNDYERDQHEQNPNSQIQATSGPVDHYEYDSYVQLAGEGASFATAAQLASLEKRNKVLMDAIEKLEDKYFESEEKRMSVQRRLLIAEEESADYRTLIDQRESQNVQIRKDLDQLGVKLQNETSRFNDVDNERRKLEHQAALIQGEVALNARAHAKLEQSLAEIETLRQKLTSMLNEKGDLDQQVTQRQKEVTELEKKLYSESSRSRDINNRTKQNLENLIENERKRAQQSIDYVRQTLKAKIRVLEAQVEADRESDTKIKKEKRVVARELKQVMRKLDEKKSEVGIEKRKIETLEKQVDAAKDRLEKLNIENGVQEQKFHSLSREVSTIATQLDSALYTNAKLNALLPAHIRIAIEEEAETKNPQKTEGGAPSKSAKVRAMRSRQKAPQAEESPVLPETEPEKVTKVEEILFDTTPDLGLEEEKL